MITLMVCPHDTVRNPEGWYRLVQYLTRQIETPIHFELALDFHDFHARLAGADLAYANPSDALRLIDQAGFQALARPAACYDEALIVAGKGDQPLSAIDGAPVASVIAMLPTRLALRSLARQGLRPQELHDCDSWLGVVGCVWNERAPFGFLYRDSYEDLSEQSRAMVHVVAATDERVAFHSLCAHPDRAPAAAISAALLAMAEGEAGREVLADLRMSGWLPVSDAEIAAMRKLMA